MYGPQIGVWVTTMGSAYTFPDGTNNCHIGDASYDQSLWGPGSKTASTGCVGPNTCLPLSGQLLAVISIGVTLAAAVAASFAMQSVRLRWKRQFHRL